MVDGGSIINLSSTFARSAHRDRVAYGASKAGVEQLTRMLALEWAARDIRVNAIAPTVIETETRRDLFANEQVRMDRIRSIPMGRLGETRDVVGVALLLASPAGRFITGQTIVVDGGETL
jgi:2-deoxy-D-gluconate 3-dehydrogenase